MLKSSKKSKETATAEEVSGASESAPVSIPGTDKPGKAARSKRAVAKPPNTKQKPSSTGKSPGSTARKGLASSRKPRAAAAARTTRKAGHSAISDEDIRIRAYFIGERRMQSGVPGDSANDWLEARRQLQEETGKSA